MSALATYFKYSAEILDYAIVWSFPDADTVASATWTIPDGDGDLTVATDPEHAASVAGSHTIVWLKKGTPGGRYAARCTMTTALGRVLVRELAIQIVG